MTEVKPFGQLSREEKIELIAAWVDGKEIQLRYSDSTWHKVTRPNWDDTCHYRVATVPDSINWDHVSPEWKYLFRSTTGTAYLSDSPPYKTRTCWVNIGKPLKATSFVSYSQGTTDWKDSLVERPVT